MSTYVKDNHNRRQIKENRSGETSNDLFGFEFFCLFECVCSTAGDQVVIDSVTTISVSKLSKVNPQSQVTRGTKTPKH